MSGMRVELFNTEYAQLMVKALETYNKRHNAIAKNVANVNNPNYEPVCVDFSDYLQQNGEEQGLKTTKDKHIRVSNYFEKEFSSMETEKGRRVDITKEMAKLAENQIRYEFVSSVLRGYYDTLNKSITGRNQ